MKSFSKTHSKGSKTFPKQENFLQKDPRKNSQRGFPRFFKNSFKEKCPFSQKFSIKKILKSFIRKSPQEAPKTSSPKIIQKSSKSPPFSQHKTILLQRKISKIFSNKKPFQQENPRIKRGISQKQLKNSFFLWSKRMFHT